MELIMSTYKMKAVYVCCTERVLGDTNTSPQTFLVTSEGHVLLWKNHSHFTQQHNLSKAAKKRIRKKAMPYRLLFNNKILDKRFIVDNDAIDYAEKKNLVPYRVIKETK